MDSDGRLKAAKTLFHELPIFMEESMDFTHEKPWIAMTNHGFYP